MARSNHNGTAAEIPFDIPRPIECLITQDETTRLWIGHCIDFDLVTSGKTPELAWVNIKAVVKLHIEHSFTHDRAGLRKHQAPSEVREVFQRLKGKKPVRSDKLELDLIPPKEPQEARDLWIEGVEQLGCTTSSQLQKRSLVV